jgi:microcin C transport system permease protein
VFSELTRRQFRKFRSVRRAWFALWILLAAFIVSLFAEHIANDRPLILRYEGRFYFPTLKFYPDETFGGPYRTEADYRELRAKAAFRSAGNFMVFPLIPHDPLHPYLDAAGAPPHPPSRLHWLGTDGSARDVSARLLYGFRTSMIFALCLVLVGAIFGILVGGVQGYLGGRTDLLVQRGIEIWSALPFLYVVILLGSIYGQGFGILLFVFALFEWIPLSYYMRAEFFRLKNLPFVMAERALGAGHRRTILRQILPNAMNPVVTILPFSLIAAISSLTALDFLGFGLPPPAPSWGELLQQGLENLQAPWLAISSVAALFVTLMLASFIGEGVREAFDPRAASKLR